MIKIIQKNRVGLNGVLAETKTLVQSCEYLFQFWIQKISRIIWSHTYRTLTYSILLIFNFAQKPELFTQWRKCVHARPRNNRAILCIFTMWRSAVCRGGNRWPFFPPDVWKSSGGTVYNFYNISDRFLSNQLIHRHDDESHFKLLLDKLAGSKECMCKAPAKIFCFDYVNKYLQQSIPRILYTTERTPHDRPVLTVWNCDREHWSGWLPTVGSWRSHDWTA